MTDPELLFSSYDLHAIVNNQAHKMAQEIDEIEEETLLNTSVDDWCDHFESQYLLHVPVLHEDQITSDQEESKVDARYLPGRFVIDRRHPVLIPGSEVRIHVPYDGDTGLFKCRPSSFTLNPPRAIVTNQELVFAYAQAEPDAASIRKQLDGELAEIKKWLAWVQANVAEFNNSIRTTARGRIEARRARLLKNREMQAALGFPLRRRPDAAQTYVVPTVRKKAAVVRPVPTKKAFAPEPTLEIGEYEHILSVISNMVTVMERSPEAFRTMKEEDLRQHFLVQLNGQYDGQATGETFNFEGKTDILIRVEGKNIFVAECKFWDGPKSLNAAVDQLLAYASWRDTKTAILVFNRGKNLTTVLQKLPEVVKAHPHYKRQVEYKSETAFRFVLHHRDDQNRELILTVLVFEVPS